MSKIDQIIQLLTKIEENTRPKIKRERTQLVGDGLPEIAKIWNEWAHKSFSRVLAMESTSTRYKNCQARWKEKPEKEFWIKVILRINDSGFCLGENDRKWLADIEFLTRPDQAYRILEGKFDNAKPKQAERKIVGYVGSEPVFGK